MSSNELILVGGGGHAGVVGQCAHLVGIEVVGIFDDDRSAKMLHRPPPPRVPAYLGGLDDFVGRAPGGWLMCVGDLGVRGRVLARYDEGASGPMIHPSAFVAPDAELEEGVFVGPMAVVHSGAKVRAHGIVNSGAVVEHDCVVGYNAHIGPGSVVGGGVRIGRGTLVGIGSTVLPGMSIGVGVVVGAGAVVVHGVEDHAVVAGNPARVMKAV